MELIEEGQVADYSPGGGWLVGFGENFRNPTLRQMAQAALAHTIGVKWMAHPQGDPRGTNKPLSEGCTLSILVSGQGNFRIEFSRTGEFAEVLRTSRLQTTGDFVIWGAGLHHQWFADADSTILTVRWVPLLPGNVEADSKESGGGTVR